MDNTQRIDSLESTVAFQEDLIESLNQSLIVLQNDIIELKRRLKLLEDYVKTHGGEGIKDIKDEVPPPHY